MLQWHVIVAFIYHKNSCFKKVPIGLTRSVHWQITCLSECPGTFCPLRFIQLIHSLSSPSIHLLRLIPLSHLLSFTSVHPLQSICFISSHLIHPFFSFLQFIPSIPPHPFIPFNSLTLNHSLQVIHLDWFTSNHLFQFIQFDSSATIHKLCFIWYG